MELFTLIKNLSQSIVAVFLLFILVCRSNDNESSSLEQNRSKKKKILPKIMKKSFSLFVTYLAVPSTNGLAMRHFLFKPIVLSSSSVCFGEFLCSQQELK